MLANEIHETQSALTYPDGTRHDTCLDGIRKRVSASQVFMMDREAVAMSASVALSKPSSILSALPWVRLPFESVWIEFLNGDLREAMQDLGSPLVPVPEGVVTIVRSGFLMTREGDLLHIEYVHADRTSGNERLADLAPVRATFLLGDERPAVVGLRGRFETHGAAGRVRSHIDLVTKDPEEARSDAELHARLSWEPHPDMAGVRRGVVGMMGEAQVAAIEENQGRELSRLFLMQVLPALILINCRNAVRAEVVPAPEKLNRQRVAKGRAPLVEHRVVRMHLSPNRFRAASASRGGDRIARGTLVIGHFKVRKTGVYWWSPHPRHGYGAVTRTTILTR